MKETMEHWNAWMCLALWNLDRITAAVTDSGRDARSVLRLRGERELAVRSLLEPNPAVPPAR